MTDQTLLILVICIIGGLLIAAGIVLLCLNHSWNKTVQTTSECLKQLNQLNRETHFYYDIQEQYHYNTSVNSKSQFDRYDINRRMLEYMLYHIDDWKLILSKVVYNRKTLKQYQIKVQAIRNAAKQENYFKVPENTYKRKEEKFFNKAIQNPRTDTSLLYTVSYTSPKGQNSYSSSWTFDTSYLSIKGADAQEALRHRESRQYQRAIMTNSMRYDVMKRDGFRCQICGRTARDGVKLHVDHIVPVSKGGKTEMSNLRTLCSDCNTGKNNKYDPSGIN